MRSAQVIVTVKQLEPSLREQGIGAIYLFGSVARETQTESSDIDLAFDLAPGAPERFSLIDQSRIQRQLAAALGTNVDLIERDYLRPRVSDRAERDMIQIF
jgi:predicted nucleotidyltransferase